MCVRLDAGECEALTGRWWSAAVAKSSVKCVCVCMSEHNAGLPSQRGEGTCFRPLQRLCDALSFSLNSGFYYQYDHFSVLPFIYQRLC